MLVANSNEHLKEWNFQEKKDRKWKNHGRSMGGHVRSVGVMGGQWEVLGGQWVVMGGHWVVLGGQWEVKKSDFKYQITEIRVQKTDLRGQSIELIRGLIKGHRVWCVTIGNVRWHLVEIHDNWCVPWSVRYKGHFRARMSWDPWPSFLLDAHCQQQWASLGVKF